MKKTLAESIREALDLINEAPAHMQDALLDLHNESGGSPTAELAADIASEYGLNAEKLLAAYPQWAQTQANKGSTAPAQDPDKAAQAKRYQDNKDRDQRRADMDAERERRRQEIKDKAAAHKEQFAAEWQEAHSYIEQFKNLEGWHEAESWGEKWPDDTKDERDHVCIQNDDVNVQLDISVNVTDGVRDEGPSVSIAGDTRFKDEEGKVYCFTRRGIDSDSFHYASNVSYLDPIPASVEEIANTEVARAAAARSTNKDFVSVPGTNGLSVKKDEIPAIADKIRKGGTHALMPYGMGIGWDLSAKKRHQWSNPAPQEMKDFFGLDQLYMDMIDAD